MKDRKAKTLGQTPGAQYKLLQRLDANAKRQTLNTKFTIRMKVRNWIRNAFGI